MNTPKDTTCKICKSPMVVYIDSEYAEFGDPLKLVKMACHDSCYDVMTKRNRATEAILVACRFLIERKRSADEISATRQRLLAATRRLAEAFATFYKSTEILWSEDFAQLLMEKPHAAGKTLYGYKLQCRDKYRST